MHDRPTEPSPAPRARRRRGTPWLLWAALTTSGAALLARPLLEEHGDRRVFLPGQTTSGHYQVELACELCHTTPFASKDEMQAACEGCHAEALKASKDSHPKAKFTDPRNAARTAALDARYCVTCHGEHREAATLEMGLTLPEDFCVHCHAEVGKERPSHAGLAFDTCDDAGCHNFHDNRALYEDFVARRLDQPDLLSPAHVVTRPSPALTARALGAADQDAPPAHALTGDALSAWVDDAHARSGVNCSACHGEGDAFSIAVGRERCQSCHAEQVAGWELGKHGMRSALGVGPLEVGLARAPMRSDPHASEQSCNACHAAHAYDAAHAAVDACLGCHADEHSASYASSRHAELYELELAGSGAPGSGVSCATCHMPRSELDDGRVVTQHDQSANLRPNEKMIRTSCIQCHGLGFSLDALADRALIRANFAGRPRRPVETLTMVRRRVNEPRKTQ